MIDQQNQQVGPQSDPNSKHTGSNYRSGVSFSSRPVVVLMLLTVGALTLVQEPFGWSWLAWLALLPWVLASVAVRRVRFGVVVSYLAGLIYFLGNLYWLVKVTAPGYAALCFYLAFYFPLIGLLLRWVYKRTDWSFMIILPVFWVAQEYLRATVMTGFPWLLLGHSQHESYRLIQICDLVGVYGVTFLLVACNGLLCDLLLRPIVRTGKRKKRFGTGTALLSFIILLVVTLVYGNWRLGQAEQTMTDGPVITVVQEVIPQYVRGSEIDTDEIFERHLVHTQAALAAEAKPELVVWPETMTAPLNREYLGMAVASDVLAASRYQDNMLALLAARHDVDILVGTPTVIMELEDGYYRQASRQNSAVLYQPGERPWQRYHKMHLVPFGEVVPFRYSWPWLYRVLNSLTPYDYEYTLDAGTEATVFQFDGAEGSWRFAVAICYEDVMPQVVRELTAVEDDAKRVDFIVNISNDGWFVRPGDDDTVVATSELLQHMVICKFRAIENRVGIARSVNTGISCFIRPDGKVQQGALAATLPDDPRDRQVVAGFLTDRIVCDSRITPYSKIGDTFAIFCTLLTIVIAVVALLDHRRIKKEKAKAAAE